LAGHSEGGKLPLVDGLKPFGEPITLKPGDDVLAGRGATAQGAVSTSLSFDAGAAVFAEFEWTGFAVHFRADDSRLSRVA
jgi:hypothetical protein